MVTNIELLKAPIQSLVSTTFPLHSNSHTWLINSAASNHISGTLLLFSNMIKITPVTIQMASSDSFTADQSGTIHIKVMSNPLNDLVAVLNGKGIMEGNKTDISALATALETFRDFKQGTTWNIGKEGTMQLIAIPKLLLETSLLHDPDRLATSNDLQKAVSDIKEVFVSSHGSPTTSEGRSYGAIMR